MSSRRRQEVPPPSGDHGLFYQISPAAPFFFKDVVKFSAMPCGFKRFFDLEIFRIKDSREDQAGSRFSFPASRAEERIFAATMSYLVSLSYSIREAAAIESS